jgi:hypothetical protein
MTHGISVPDSLADALLHATPDTSNVTLIDLSGDTPPRLEDYLKLTLPAGTTNEAAFTQLRYLDSYVLDHEGRAKTAMIEHEYIDRHWSADYAAFYSRSLRSIGNICRRVHFFTLPSAELASKIAELQRRAGTQSRHDFDAECEAFSENYLGFVVIRPLPGVPVGTTILRHFPSEPRKTNPDFRREFGAVRKNTVHVLGLRLVISALGFQQQDHGVAACATTALWVSLQQVRPDEEFPPTTPSEITTRAITAGEAPLGREMPSAGLTDVQMCAAIHDVGLSPSLTRVTDAWAAIAEMVSSVRSHRAPILILRNLDDPTRHHAVALVGMKCPNDRVRKSPHPMPAPRIFDDDVYAIEDFYVHDDRLGPYVLGRFVPLPPPTSTCRALNTDPLCHAFLRDALTHANQPTPDASAQILINKGQDAHAAKAAESPNRPGLLIRLREKKHPRTSEDDHSDAATSDKLDNGWHVLSIITPTHRKQHFAFRELLVLGSHLHAHIATAWQQLEPHEDPTTREISLGITFPRLKNYAWSLLEAPLGARVAVSTSAAAEFSRRIAGSRYVGVIRFGLRPGPDWFDVLVDTTSTPNSPNYLAVVAPAEPEEQAFKVASAVATFLRVPLIAGRRVS